MEWAEFSKLYGYCKVKFTGYYKYIFTFEGDGLRIEAGGNHDDIYRFDVEPDKEYEVRDLPIYRAYKGEDCIYEE